MDSNTHSSDLVVILNADKVLEYKRSVALTKKQLSDLELLDQKLEHAFPPKSFTTSESDARDKATLVANMLVAALLEDDDPKIALSCAYLATRYSGLKQVKARTESGQVAIQLIFDEEYKEATPMKFVAKKDLN